MAGWDCMECYCVWLCVFMWAYTFAVGGCFDWLGNPCFKVMHRDRTTTLLVGCSDSKLVSLINSVSALFQRNYTFFSFFGCWGVIMIEDVMRTDCLGTVWQVLIIEGIIISKENIKDIILSINEWLPVIIKQQLTSNGFWDWISAQNFTVEWVMTSQMFLWTIFDFLNHLMELLVIYTWWLGVLM